MNLFPNKDGEDFAAQLLDLIKQILDAIKAILGGIIPKYGFEGEEYKYGEKEIIE